jgi:hypothetical protein
VQDSKDSVRDCELRVLRYVIASRTDVADLCPFLLSFFSIKTNRFEIFSTSRTFCTSDRFRLVCCALSINPSRSIARFLISLSLSRFGFLDQSTQSRPHSRRLSLNHSFLTRLATLIHLYKKHSLRGKSIKKWVVTLVEGNLRGFIGKTREVWVVN